MASQDSKSVIDCSRVDAQWLSIQDSTKGLQLSRPLITRLAEGAALLAAVASKDPSPEARIAEAWLLSSGRTSVIALCGLEDIGL